MRVATVTVCSGRHKHLRAQRRSLDRGHLAPDLAVVVSVDDPGVARVVDRTPAGRFPTSVVDLPRAEGHLPVARARNEGAARATAQGADLIVFLDVDVLASPELVVSYVDAADRMRYQAPVVWAGPVAYLPRLPEAVTEYPPDALRTAAPHPERPAPAPGRLVRGHDFRLFWSLSFAIRPPDFEACGGFDTEYVGYGGEDTDFGQRLAHHQGELWWVGGALGYHQWHPVSDPPVEHVADIVRNATLFHQRWGWWPMETWLQSFQEIGRATYDATRDTWSVVS